MALPRGRCEVSPTCGSNARFVAGCGYRSTDAPRGASQAYASTAVGRLVALLVWAAGAHAQLITYPTTSLALIGSYRVNQGPPVVFPIIFPITYSCVEACHARFPGFPLLAGSINGFGTTTGTLLV
jgi:hypothetical protein